MKIVRTTGDQGGRAVKKPGLFYSYYDKKRGWITRSWPRPRGAPKSLAQAQTMQQMAMAAWVCKRAQAWETDYAREQTKGSEWTWRDYYMSALYGRNFEVYFKNGDQWQSLRVMADQIQLLLDALSTTPGALITRDADKWIIIPKGTAGQVLTCTDDNILPHYLDPDAQAMLDNITDVVGSMLFRGEDGWEALGPGTVGQILTSNGPDTAPTWDDGSGAGQPGNNPVGVIGGTDWAWNANTAAGANFFTGRMFLLTAGTKVKSLAFGAYAADATQHWQAAIYPYAALALSNRVAVSAAQLGIVAGVNVADFSAEYTVPTTQIYACGIWHDGTWARIGSGAASPRVYFAATGSAPTTPAAQTYEWASTANPIAILVGKT